MSYDIAEGGWAKARHEMPIFRTSSLITPDVMHSDRCATRLDDAGEPVGRRCTCYSTRRRLPKNKAVQIVILRDEQALVDPLIGAPCWVERRGLRFARRPHMVEVRKRNMQMQPPDYKLLDTVLLRGPIKLPRRRRTPHGGEIVFLRTELKDPEIEAEPLRLLCQIHRDGAMAAVLIDPKLTFDQALSPSWTQRREVPLLRDDKTITLAQALVPVFPLPDGTSSPGWIPFTEEQEERYHRG